ncbi:Protein of unknown function (DUF2971) [Gramella sp. Hel_I_59]|uniref:DUF2971 domain-containing protein n=1 Tax=Gramella sp. Hel_I_59 TaxID=1249978 RepID=UPI00115153E2|nr:DUF2971 domain-containing protein [Gramella sp. Hel_I_59]TQI71117.1 Protein of unknown function (DUF2971) [Gramella sp. Hel_I_59]
MEESEIIYKYKDFKEEYSKKILLENELFLSSLISFNDPFDCKIPPCLELLETKERAFEYAERILSNQKLKILLDGQDFEKVSENYKNSMWKNPEIIQKNISEVSIDTQSKILGILCLTKKWNDILMWSHYGQNHQGICYGFDFKSITNSKNFHYGGSVKYTNTYPLIDPIDAILPETYKLQTHYKAKKWKYEKEYRLVKIYDQDIEPFSEQRKFKIPDSFFKEIIIGAEFPNNEIQKIIDIAKAKKIALFKAKKADWKFELKRERII